MMKLEPYLFFQGNCREAMEFYKSVFGGELTMQTMDEVPPEAQMPGMEGKIMHSRLETGEISLMGSDSPQASEKAAKIELSIMGDDEGKLRGLFDALSAGGTVKMELKKQFWGDTFGQLTDKYNIDWMFNITAPK